jgi:hypothetical protein
MSKNLTILWFISVAMLGSNTILAQNVVQDVSETANIVEKDLLSGKSISYVQGYVEGIDSCCK